MNARLGAKDLDELAAIVAHWARGQVGTALEADHLMAAGCGDTINFVVKAYDAL